MGPQGYLELEDLEDTKHILDVLKVSSYLEDPEDTEDMLGILDDLKVSSYLKVSRLP